MTDEELVARLRAWEPLISSGHIVSAAGQSLHEAADRIEALTAENKWLYARIEKYKRALGLEIRGKQP